MVLAESSESVTSPTPQPSTWIHDLRNMAEPIPFDDEGMYRSRYISPHNLEEVIIFQNIDIHNYVDPEDDARDILMLFGVTEAGHSVCCKVLHFLPYFHYIPPPNAPTSREDLDAFSGSLKAKLDIGVEHIYGQLEHESDKSHFFKIYVRNRPALRVVKDEFNLYKTSDRLDVRFRGGSVCEDKLNTSTRFMVDKEMVAMSWIEASPGSYSSDTEEKLSSCQIEFSVHHKDLIIHTPSSAPWDRIVPLRIMSFDIETNVPHPDSHTPPMPRPTADAVFQIATMVSTLGSSTINALSSPPIRVIFTLDTCDPVEGAVVRSFGRDDEYGMIEAWMEFVREVDPDVFTGFNIGKFDLPYLIHRMNHAQRRFVLGRVRWLGVSSRIVLDQTKPPPVIPGRPQLDVYAYFRHKYGTSPWGEGQMKLGPLAHRFLGMAKEDISFRVIPALQGGTSATRSKLGLYCLKDAWLPLKFLSDPGLGIVDDAVKLARKQFIVFDIVFDKERDKQARKYALAKSRGVVLTMSI